MTIPLSTTEITSTGAAAKSATSLKRKSVLGKLFVVCTGIIGSLCFSAKATADSSMDMAYEVRSGNDRVFVANPDQDSVTAVDAVTGARLGIVGVGDEPRSVALDGNGNLWVTNKGDATISIVNTTSLSVSATFPGPRGSRPHGIVIDTNNNRAYVVLEALGQVLQLDSISGALLNTATVGAHPREVSLSNDGSRIYLPRFITQPTGGESTRSVAQGSGQVAVLNTSGLGGVAVINIPYNAPSGGNDSNNSARGIPNYLRALAISPTSNQAWLPAKVDNIYRGTMRDGRAREHNMLTRGILSNINLQSSSENVANRIQFPDNSHPTAVAYSPNGNLLYVVHEGSRAFEVINANNGNVIFASSLGFAPTGVVVSNDGNRVFVHNWLSRTLSIIDSSGVNSGASTNAPVISTVNLTTSEALSAQVLRGKRLFFDSADPRLSGQRYLSCASCHDEGGQDGRVYDFSDVGEGLRNTADMRGRGDMEDGLVHWTANFDEIQDFEHALREIFGGTGLMSNSAFAASSTPIDPAGMKTGRSADLDALVAFVDTLDDHGLSPFRQQSGALTAAGLSGRQVFENASCATCHSGSNFTDSPLGGSHNIGTVDADTGGRFGQPLLNGGLDTPTLQGLWNSAPYLHDGSALTVRAAIDAHTQNMPIDLSGFSSAELNNLADYVLQIDDTEPAPQPPIVQPPTPDTFSTLAAIGIDGNMSDWPTSAIVGSDPQDSTGGANVLDYQTLWMANDQDNLYIRYRNHQPNNTQLTWGYGQAVDVDGTGNGYRGFNNAIPIGVDFLIEEQNIYRYTGNGVSWSWAWVTSMPVAFNGRNAEIAIPRTVLGGSAQIDLFMYADNNAVGGTAIDFFPDSAPNTNLQREDRFITYEFAGGTVQPPPPPPPPTDDPFVFYNPVNGINVNGNLSEWATLELFDDDPNDANNIDFLLAGVAHNNNSFFFGIANDGPTTVTWGNAIFVDSDINGATGFRGFQNESPTGIDYLIEAQSVYRYTGNGNSWAWQWVGGTTVATSGNNIEINVPASLIGNPQTIDLFYYGDSSAVGGSGVDFYPDAAVNTAAAITDRRFRYTRDANQAVNDGANELLTSRMNTTASGGGAGGMGILSMMAILIISLRRRILARKFATTNLSVRKPALPFTVLVASLFIASCDGSSSGNPGTIAPPAGQAGSNPETTLTFSTGNSSTKPNSGLLETTLSGDNGSTLSFEDLQTLVFGPMCSGCHNGGGTTQPSVFDFRTADATHASMVNQPSTSVPARILVAPGDASNSYLMESLAGTQSSGSRMPMRAAPLTDEMMQAVRNWINSGANR